jgi:glycosyltransferase involved in cell wall biosynthesis
MHIAVFSQYHTSPDCPATSRHYTLLAELVKHHRVTLLTTPAWRTQQLTHDFPWVPPGVELQEAAIPYENKMGPARRALAFAQFAAWAVRAGRRIARPDVVWGISTPLTAAWAAARVARSWQVPWVFEVQDLWPSFPVAMGVVPGKLLQNQLFALERRLYESAAHIVPLSPDMSRYVAELGIPAAKITTLLNGTDLNLAARATPFAVAKLRREYGLEGQRVVLYAGTFGRANDMPTVVAAAEALVAADPTATWLFLGHGYHTPLVEAAAVRWPGRIRLVGGQPRHAVFSWFSLADVAVVSFLDIPVLDTNSPAKLYDALAVGTPIIVTNKGWTKTLVEQHGCGWYTPAGDVSSLVATLRAVLAAPSAREAAGQRGRALALAEFDRVEIAARMRKILEQAAGKG